MAKPQDCKIKIFIPSRMTSLNVEHSIYKILPDALDAVLGIELRNVDHKTAFVQALQVTDEPIFNLSPLPRIEIPWWTNVLGCFQGIFLTHSFGEPSVPKPTHLEAFNAYTGERLWSAAETLWLETLDSTVRVKISAEERLLDLRTGEPATTLPTEISKETARFPVHYAEGSPHLFPLQKLIRHLTGQQPIGACDYLEFPHSIIFSYYFYESEKLKNDLLVVSKAGNVLFHESLQTGEGLGHTTFMVWRNQLVFIKDQVYLCWHAVS